MRRVFARAAMRLCGLALAAPAVLALSAACSWHAARSADGAPELRPAPQPLVLEETAWRWIGAVPYPYMLAVDVAYVVRNPNAEAGAREATLVVEARGPDGAASRQELPIGPIRPGETVAGGAQVFPGAEAAPSDVTFTLLQPKAWEARGQWQERELVRLAVRGLERRETTGPPAAEDVGFAQGHSYFTGAVVNGSASGVDGCRIVIVHRDGSGRIVACYEALAYPWSDQR